MSGPRAKNVSPVGVAECEGLAGPCKFCARCGEWWPLTDEYWYRLAKARQGRVSRWQSWCRACFTESARIATARRKATKEG